MNTQVIARETTVNGAELEPLCQCGEESEYGCHGVRDGEVYSEYLCKKCHNRSKI